MLARRTRISIEAWDRGVSAAPVAAELMAEVLGWDDAQLEDEVDALPARVEAERRASWSRPTRGRRGAGPGARHRLSLVGRISRCGAPGQDAHAADEAPGPDVALSELDLDLRAGLRVGRHPDQQADGLVAAAAHGPAP